MRQTVAIVGIGLIGGSLGQALRKSGRYRVIGISRKMATVRLAKRLGAIDSGSTHLKDIKEADILVVCTPVALIVPTIDECKRFLKPQAIVTDVGSVKSLMHKNVRGVRFVGSHPLAGSHRMGVAAASAALFKNATCVVVPQDRSAMPAVRKMWVAAGARVLELSATTHDALVALSSHLPHLIAHSLVRAAMKTPHQKQLKALLAGSFRDATRVASADAKQWMQIFQSNRKPLLTALRQFSTEINRLRSRLAHPDFHKTLKKSQSYRATLFNGI